MSVSRVSFIKYLESKTAKWPRRYIRHLFGSAGFFYGPKLFLFVMEESFCLKPLTPDRVRLLRLRDVHQFYNAGKPFGRWLEVPIPTKTSQAKTILPFLRRAYLGIRRGNKK